MIDRQKESQILTHIGQLLKRVPPEQINQVVIIASVTSVGYRSNLKQSSLQPLYLTEFEEVHESIPVCYRLSSTQTLVDCGPYFLNDSLNPFKTILNRLYLFSVAKSIKILFPINGAAPQENHQVQIKEVFQAFEHAFATDFFLSNYPNQIEQISNSVGFLIYREKANQNEYLSRFQKITNSGIFETSQSSLPDKIFQNAIFNQRLVQSLYFQRINNKIDNFEGFSISQQACNHFFSCYKKNYDNASNSLEQIGEFCSNTIKVIKKNVHSFFNKKYEEFFECIEEQLPLFLDFEIDHREKIDSLFSHPIEYAVSFLNKLDQVNCTKKQNSYFGLVNFLLKEVGQKMYGYRLQRFSFILHKLFRFFPYLEELIDLQKKLKQELNELYQSILDEIFQILSVSKQNDKNIRTIIIILEGLLRRVERKQFGKYSHYWSDEYSYQKSFQLILVEYKCLYFFKLVSEKCLSQNEKRKKMIECEDILRKEWINLDKKCRNSYLKKLYKIMGKELERSSHLYFAVQCYRNGKWHYSLFTAYKKYIEAKYEQRSVGMVDIKEVFEEYSRLGLYEEGRKLCYRYLEEEENQESRQQIYIMLYREMEKENDKLRESYQNFIDDSMNNVELIENNQMMAIKNILKALMND